MKRLLAQTLMEDPRVMEAKQLLLAALTDVKNEMKGVQAPSGELKESYANWIARANQSRGGNIWYPFLGSGVGNGALVELADGSVKYDFISGIGVHYYGHSHDEMLDCGVDAALADTIQQGHLQQNTDSVELMEELVALAQKNGGDMAHCFLSTSGAMANENALKMMFQKNAPATRMLSFYKCFSGRTLALAQLTDKAAYRVGLPNAMAVDYIPFYDAERPQESTAEALGALREHLARFPGQYAGMCMELIQGEGGYNIGSEAFFKALIEVLIEHGVAVWIDEVQTFGRLSEPFAFQYFGLDGLVDVVTIGKMSQICATLFTDAYRAKPGLLSQTFTSSGQAIKAGLHTVRGLAQGDLLVKNMRMNAVWTERMEKIDHVSGGYGLGAMFAMTVGDGSIELAKKFSSRLFENGVITFIAGSGPTRIRCLPPIAAIEEADVHAVCDIIEATVKEVMS